MKQEIKQAIAELHTFLKNERPDKANLISYLRGTPLPFIACYHQQLSASECFELSFRFLHTLGKYNMALAVGICMNQYIAYSIAYLPVAPGSTLHVLKNEFLKRVVENKWILAVSSFDDFIRSKDDAGHSVQCVSQEDGTVVCNGIKNFQSNITEADVLLFSADLDQQGTRLFYTFLNDMPGVSFGEPMFPGAMEDADTRAVKFDNAILQPFQMVPTDSDDETLGLHALTRVVFSVMAMAPYMGGALRAMEEASTFLNSVHLDGERLASKDGFITDMGRACIQYQICEDLVERFACSINRLSQDSMSAWLTAERTKGLAAKHHITAVCEQLVDQSRKIIGTRSLLPKHIISKISSQIVFGALHPVVNAKIERELGQGFLVKR